MLIEEQHLYSFKFRVNGDIFPVLNAEAFFPVRAENKEEAADHLLKLFAKMQSELLMDFPRMRPAAIAGENVEAPDSTEPVALTAIPPEVLELRMDTLLDDLGAGGITGKAKSETVKSWTGYALKEENYAAIILELELIKAGKKEVPTKTK